MLLGLHAIKWNSVLKGNKELRSEEGRGYTHTQHICFISDANAVMVQDNPGQSSWFWMYGVSDREYKWNKISIFSARNLHFIVIYT